MLIWAREQIGMTVSEVAEQVKRPVEEVRGWEAGLETPSFPQLERLARQVYRQPLALFFMKEPPEVPTLQENFRTLGSNQLQLLQRDTRLAIRRVQARQDYLRELFGADDYSRSALAGLDVTLQRAPTEVAAEARAVLDYTPEAQRADRDPYKVLAGFRSRLELQRVFTFQEAMSDIRGFALWDEAFPVIGLQGSDHIAGRVFSIGHELGHILLGDSDIMEAKSTGQHSRSEQWCNAFASAFILPPEAIEAAAAEPRVAKQVDDKVAYTKAIASRYGVSATMVARRLSDAGEISNAEYNQLAKLFGSMAKAGKSIGGGPSFYKKKRSSLGNGYIQRTFELLDEGRFTYSDAAGALGVKVNQFERLLDEVR